MLSRNNLYAVCRTQPEKGLAIATNYASIEGGVLTAPLNIKGLLDLLSWVDRTTAEMRFNQLVTALGRPAVRFVGHRGTAD